MKPSSPTTSAKKPSESELVALVNLLSDEDPLVYTTVRNRILACGAEAREWMRPHVLSGDPLLRRRSREIVRHFARQDADTRFISFCLEHGEDFDLEAGVWLIAQTTYPDINVEAYQAILDGYVVELGDRIELGSEGAETLAGINKYLFEELAFKGNETSYYDPQNSYLNRVIDRRTGNPIQLSLLYMLLARRLQLPICGIGLPGHFICRYQSASEEIYIDAFNRGRFMTRNDCVQMLAHLTPPVRDELLAPASPRRILTRICANLHEIYRRLGLREEMVRLKRYQIALNR